MLEDLGDGQINEGTERPDGSRPVSAKADRLCAQCPVRSGSVCGVLTRTDMRRLRAQARQAFFAHRQPVFFQDDPNTSVYNVVDGVIRLQTQLPDGHRQVVGFALPGDFLGLSYEETNAVEAIAVGNVIMCRFDRSAFFDLADEKPMLMRRLYQVTRRELALAQSHNSVILGNLEERIAGFILGFRRRWESVNGPSATVHLPMTQRDIGDHLGMTFESVCRTFAKLQREKIVLVVPKGVRILDEQRLYRRAPANWADAP